MDNPHGLRDLELMLFDKVVAFDNVRQTVTLIVNMPLDGDLKVAYNQAATELDRLERLLREGERCRNGEGRLTGPDHGAVQPRPVPGHGPNAPSRTSTKATSSRSCRPTS